MPNKNDNPSPKPPTHTDPDLYPKLKARAREMRRNPTVPENRLWQRLRGRQVRGAKFRRQHPIGPYIADFYCAAASLVIEVDGPSHEEAGQAEADAVRAAYLAAAGLRVLRVTNAEVMGNMAGVLERIAELLRERGVGGDDEL
jgi:very-short-patch-repair endonuclease